MASDPNSRNDDELLSQIDELKARMDRLMRGGTSTSNSALLTDDVKPGAKPGAEEPADRPADPAPDRTRVRDLIGSEDVEVVEAYPGPKSVVPFPDDGREDPAVAAAAPQQPEPEPAPESTPPRAAPIGGSVINVDGDHPEPRPQVATFDDLGSAIHDELAKDVSVPPVDVKKGPDLASRFGPAEEPVAKSEPPAAVIADVADEVEEDDDTVEDVPFVPEEQEVVGPERRGSAGLVAAIWIVAAVASGAIATLHFTGII
jgi:hypothetical protein